MVKWEGDAREGSRREENRKGRAKILESTCGNFLSANEDTDYIQMTIAADWQGKGEGERCIGPRITGDGEGGKYA